MAASTSYSPRFYTSGGVVLPNFPAAGQMGVNSLSLSETIPTTDQDFIGDLRYLFPLPGDGTRRLHGFWISAAAMDSNATKTLNANLVLIYILNGVVTVDPTPIYNSSVAGTFQTAVAMKWVDSWRPLQASDDGKIHVAWQIVTVSATPAAGNLTLVPYWSTGV
jgi:hypothetical protein